MRLTAVDLAVSNSTGVIEAVRSGTADLGFIETPHLPDHLHRARVRSDDLGVVVAPGHPWSTRDQPLSMRELAATPLVMREDGSGTLDALAELLLREDPPLTARPIVEFGNSASVRSTIAARHRAGGPQQARRP